MSNLQFFNLVSHYTGTASTAGSVSQSLTVGFDGSSVNTPMQSYVQWRPAKQTTAPDKRFFRSFKTQSFVYLITLKPTTSAWQSRLSEIEIGYTRFVRPNHVHCIPNFTPLSIGSFGSGFGDTDVTIRDPSGNAIPFAVVACRRRSYSFTFNPAGGGLTHAIWTGFGNGRFDNTLTSDTTVYVQANSSGVAANVLNSVMGTTITGTAIGFGINRIINMANVDTFTVYDPRTAWRGVVNLGAHTHHDATSSLSTLTNVVTGPSVGWGGFIDPPTFTFSGAQSRSVTSYIPNPQSSNAISGAGAIWPQDTFTAWGAAYVLADRDWMPRVIVTPVSSGSPVDFTASMTLWRIGNSRLDLTSGNYYATARADATPTGNSTSTFAFSRHEALPPGLYWRTTGYPGSYMSPTARWSAVPGSNVTGYTPPAEEPSCPFVVKQGTI